MCVCVDGWLCADVRAQAFACVRVSLLIQYAMRRRHIVCVPSVSTILSTLSHKRCDFRKKVTERKMCVLISSTVLFETFLILRKNQRDTVMKVKTLHVSYLLFLSDFNKTSVFSKDFRKKSQISTLIKIRLVGAELYHAN